MNPADTIARAAAIIDGWRRLDAATGGAIELDGEVSHEDAAVIVAAVHRLARLGVRFDPTFLADVLALQVKAIASEVDGDTELSVDDGLEDDDPNADTSVDDGMENDDPDFDASDELLDREDDDWEAEDPHALDVEDIDEHWEREAQRVEDDDCRAAAAEEQMEPNLDIASREAMDPVIDLHTRQTKKPKKPRKQPKDRSGHTKQRTDAAWKADKSRKLPGGRYERCTPIA